MENTPLIIAPVGATPAYKHGTLKVAIGERTMSTFRAFSYSQTFNVFDLPVVVVPAGRTSEGLPIGVQIIGRPFAEESVIAAAALIEAALGAGKRRRDFRTLAAYPFEHQSLSDNLRSDIVSIQSFDSPERRHMPRS